jgi:peptidoglycan hydrolase-like protein with peptidoglycan-binding domain
MRRGEFVSIRPVIVIVAVGLIGVALIGQDPSQESSPVVPVVDSALLRNCVPMGRNDLRVDCVRRLQDVLRVRGAPIRQTGNYFAGTEAAVVEFQEARGLRRNGIVDVATLDGLLEPLSNYVQWGLRRECVTLRHNNAGTDSQGGCVVALRGLLNAHGADLPDGDRFDRRTDAAVRAFQMSVGLPAAGLVGPKTKEALYGSLPPEYQSMTDPVCNLSRCVLYFSKSMTEYVASVVSENDLVRYAIAAGLSMLVCRQAKTVPGLSVVCQQVVSYIINTVVDIDMVLAKAQQAGQRNACLAVSVGYSGGNWSLLSPVVEGGSQCRG